MNKKRNSRFLNKRVCIAIAVFFLIAIVIVIGAHQIRKNNSLAESAIDLLAKSETNGNSIIWDCEYDELDTSKHASPYTQALASETFVNLYHDTHNTRYLEYAIKSFDYIVEQRNTEFDNSEVIWFDLCEEDGKQFDLISQLTVTLAADKLYDASGDDVYQEIRDDCLAELKEHISYFNTGDGYRDNALPQSEAVTFRFMDEYGVLDDYSFIEKVVLKNPIENKEYDIKMANQDGVLQFTLPDIELEPFVDTWLVLSVTYNDNSKMHCCVEKQSILDESKWVAIEDGDLLLTGSNEKREWKIPIRPNDLADASTKESQYIYYQALEEIAKLDEDFSSFSDTCRGYYYMNYCSDEDYEQIDIKKTELPVQTPLSTIMSLDSNNVLRMHVMDPQKSVYDEKENGLITKDSIVGKPYYNLQGIYYQYFTPEVLTHVTISDYTDQVFWNKYKFLTDDNAYLATPKAALKWIVNNVNEHNGIATWSYDMDNAYNDLEQKAPWISAYGQSLMLKVMLDNYDTYPQLAREATKAFTVGIDEGGLAYKGSDGVLWYEEVPNCSHIFNADILTINSLNEANEYIEDVEIEESIECAISSLKENIWRFDNGYWSKYDMNPQKDILFQIDILDGDGAVAISEIDILDPISGKKTVISAESLSGEQYPNLLGIDWTEVTMVDGVNTTQLVDGYSVHNKEDYDVQQNTFFRFAIPKLELNDYFDLVGYQLVIKYKDISTGKYEIKRQSICEGNVLEFERIPNAVIECDNDGQWKEFTLNVRPQDLGWYMGAEYQKFHVEQLEELGTKLNDWFILQYAEKWKYYLAEKES